MSFRSQLPELSPKVPVWTCARAVTHAFAWARPSFRLSAVGIGRRAEHGFHVLRCFRPRCFRTVWLFIRQSRVRGHDRRTTFLPEVFCPSDGCMIEALLPGGSLPTVPKVAHRPCERPLTSFNT